MPLRVVFAEDNYLVREGTAALLATAEEVDLVGTAASLDELLSAVAEHSPDAVLTDIRMPPSGTDEGIRGAKQIRSTHPDIGVVVLSQFAEEEYAYDLLKDGGILMSVTTTSGSCSPAVSRSVGASSATPTTSMSS